MIAVPKITTSTIKKESDSTDIPIKGIDDMEIHNNSSIMNSNSIISPIISNIEVLIITVGYDQRLSVWKPLRSLVSIDNNTSTYLIVEVSNKNYDAISNEDKRSKHIVTIDESDDENGNNINSNDDSSEDEDDGMPPSMYDGSLESVDTLMKKRNEILQWISGKAVHIGNGSLFLQRNVLSYQPCFFNPISSSVFYLILSYSFIHSFSSPR